MKNQTPPKNLSEAIAQLEQASHSVASDLKGSMEKDFGQLKTALEGLQPHLEEIKSKVKTEAEETKLKIETQVQKNPWLALGVVGILGLILGLLIGRKGDK